MRAAAPCPPGSAPLDSRREASRGMVLWLTLVAMLFFVALTAYAFNLGNHAARQQATQDAADAAAHGGAGEVARVLNLIADGNTEMARLIVAAQLLDAMPQATAYTLADQEAYLASLQALPAPSGGYAALVASAISHKAQVTSDLQAQVNALRPVVNKFWTDYASCAPDHLENLTVNTGCDVRESTWYQTPTGQRGGIWKAAVAMDKVGQALVDKLPVMAAAAAVASGTKNLGGGSENLAGAVPLRIEVPCKYGTFDDFYKPIVKGQIPDVSGGADTTNHRGPYDALWGWIAPVRAAGTSIPGPPSAPPPSDGSPFGGQSGGGGGTYIPGPIIGYGTQGIFSRLIDDGFRGRVGGARWNGGDQAGSLPQAIAVNTELTHRVGRLAARKLAMVQGGAGPWSGVVNDLAGGQLPDIYVPRWIAPFDTAKQAAQVAGRSPTAPINQGSAYAAWIRVEEPSRIPNASWEVMRIGQGNRYFRTSSGATVDMFFEAPPATFRVKLGEGMFVTFTPVPIIDPDTGAVIGTNPTNPVYYFWAGVNTPAVRVRDSADNTPPADPTTEVNNGNPNNWSGGAEIPAPVDLLPAYASPPTSTVPGQWCVLGFASRPNTAVAVSSRFHSAGNHRHVTLAQAQVFNNHSWDLWTPMWHARLVPIEQYDTWLATLRQTQGQAGGDDGMNTGELPDFVRHLEAVRPLAPLITH